MIISTMKSFLVSELQFAIPHSARTCIHPHLELILGDFIPALFYWMRWYLAQLLLMKQLPNYYFSFNKYVTLKLGTR